MDEQARESLLDRNLSPTRYRRAVGRIPAPVLLAAATTVDGGIAAVVLNGLATLSHEPPLVGFFVPTVCDESAALLRAAAWSFTLVDADARSELQALRRAGRGWGDLAWEPSGHGTPQLTDAPLTLHAVRHEAAPVGRHSAIVARVVHVRLGDPVAQPLTVHAGRVARLDPGPQLDAALWASVGSA